MSIGRGRSVGVEQSGSSGNVRRMVLPPLDPARSALRDHVLEHSVKHGDFTLK